MTSRRARKVNLPLLRQQLRSSRYCEKNLLGSHVAKLRRIARPSPVMAVSTWLPDVRAVSDAAGSRASACLDKQRRHRPPRAATDPTPIQAE